MVSQERPVRDSRVVARAPQRPFVQPLQKEQRGHQQAQQNGSAPARLPLQGEFDSKPNRHHEQHDVKDGKNQLQGVVGGTQPLVTALPGIRHLKRFFAAADAVALDGHLQPVGRVFRAKAVFFPGEGPICPVRLFLGIRFFGERIPGAEIHAQFGA